MPARNSPKQKVSTIEEANDQVEQGVDPEQFRGRFAARLADQYGQDLGERMCRSFERVCRSRRPPPPIVFTTGDVYMPSGDSYTTGQAGAVGRGATANNTTFHNAALPAGVSLPDLLAALTALREHLEGLPGSVERAIALGEVATVEQAAAAGDRPRVMSLLKGVSRWTLKTATDLGSRLVVEAVKAAMAAPAAG